MVFPAAESFAHGSNGHFLLDATTIVENFDVVVVVVNVRLNVFGFLGSQHLKDSDGAGTGNLGLLDLKAALEWIRNNIADFGGDPTRVTAFGSNAGSVCLHYLMLFTKDNLFDRVILQTGTVGTCPPKSLRKADRVVDTLCGILGIGGSDAAKKINDLRQVSTEKLMDALKSLKSSDPDLYATAWHPTFDGVLINQDYRQIEASGSWDKTIKRVIVGSCEAAGSLFFTRTAESRLKLLAEGQPPAELPDLVTESLFGEPCDFTADCLAAREDTIAAKYSWNRLLRRTELLGNAASHHAMELPFVFLSQLLSPAELELGTEIVRRWTAFAASGDVWSRYTRKDPTILMITPRGISIGPEAVEPAPRRLHIRHEAHKRSAKPKL